MNDTDRELVEAYCGRFRRFKRVETEVDGWTVVLDVWRENKPKNAEKIPYRALLATGLKETGEYTAIMDCDFTFPKGYRKVMKDIQQSIENEGAMKRLLTDAVRMMQTQQKKQQGGKLLQN